MRIPLVAVRILCGYNEFCYTFVLCVVGEGLAGDNNNGGDCEYSEIFSC